MEFISRQTALAQGMTDAHIHRATRAGTLIRVRRGVLCSPSEWEALTAAEQYAERARAATRALSIPAVVSHESAAVLHGLPLLHPDYGTVHLSLHGHSGGHRGPRTLHRCPLDPLDVTTVDGIRVTTPARTAVDIACAGSFAQGVCIVESALRAGTSGDHIGAALLRIGRRRGIAVARAAVEYADGHTDSIGESWSRALMHGWDDIPEPRLQHRFVTAAGFFVARTDFDWDGRLVGEFDGRVKYGEGARATIIEERKRENRLQAMGIHVMRWTWDDLLRPDNLHRILREGLDRVGL